MALMTTTIGAFPKPSYLPTPDWFRTGLDDESPTVAYDAFLQQAPDNLEELYEQATADVVEAQVTLGIDVPAEGEIRRENYIHYQCRAFDGIDFDHLTSRQLRGGSWVAKVPTITGPIHARPMLARDYRVAQMASDRPVKMSIPGPLTISDSTANEHYPDDAAAGAALAGALNQEILGLVEAGCTWIQIDEPVFARRPSDALAYGFDNLERCLEGVPGHVSTVVHMCCGYPSGLDLDNYPKADKQAYLELAPAVEESTVDAVSIEDAHRHNDLSLLDRFETKTVILGSIAIASSRLESTEEIAQRLTEAVDHVETERLMVAPDCGLGLLGEELAARKLANMVSAAKAVG